MSKSPFIDRLRLDLDRTDDPAVKGLRRAELAACHARLGEFETAQEEISALRHEFGDGRSGRVSIMIMCAEAQLIYYKNLGEQARDRMMRAQLLSVAGRDAALTALTSAWLAHISFNLHRHGELVRCAKTCLDTVSAGDHEAVSRLALTLGDAFYAAEQPVIGDRWYSKAHEHAVKLGDHSTIGALTYNRAAMGTFMQRVWATRQEADASVVAQLSGQVRTAINYQAIAQLRSLQPLLDYTLASVSILAERYADALGTLSKLVESNPATSPLERALVLRCDQALCLAKTDRTADAEAIARSTSLDRITDCTSDDQVVALAALSQVAQICKLPDLLLEVESRLVLAQEEYARGALELRELLAAFGEAATIARL